MEWAGLNAHFFAALAAKPLNMEPTPSSGVSGFGGLAGGTGSAEPSIDVLQQPRPLRAGPPSVDISTGDLPSCDGRTRSTLQRADALPLILTLAIPNMVPYDLWL